LSDQVNAIASSKIVCLPLLAVRGETCMSADCRLLNWPTDNFKVCFKAQPNHTVVQKIGTNMQAL